VLYFRFGRVLPAGGLVAPSSSSKVAEEFYLPYLADILL
jgi:hypothetical protein